MSTLLRSISKCRSRRGRAKPELGFEIGLPRAAITTLLLEPPDPAIKRVNLTTRHVGPNPANAPPEPRRVPALDVKQFASRPGQETGYAPRAGGTGRGYMGAARPHRRCPADRVQSAELDLAVLLTEGAVETTARIKLHGPAREWKVVAPAIATLSVNRAVGVTDIGPAQAPTVTKPASAAKPVWTIVFPAGSTPADWVVTAIVPQDRPKADDPSTADRSRSARSRSST